MRIVILTSNRKGTASYCLPVLREAGADIVQVIYCERLVKSKSRFYGQKLRKLWKIGLMGAINGVRMRKWYAMDSVEGTPIEDIGVLCERLNIPFAVSSGINSASTLSLLKACDPDLGLSLGNSYIASKIFTLPRKGMINIHGEVLPQFQNAQSVIWQLYEGNAVTGYTIHVIDKKIDTGEIVKQEVFPIRFKDTLGETVRASCERILARAAKGLAEVVTHYDELYGMRKAQGKGRSYTTPSFRQMLRIHKNYKTLKQKACAESREP